MKIKIFLAVFCCLLAVVMMRQFYFITSLDETFEKTSSSPPSKTATQRPTQELRNETESRPVSVKVLVEEVGSKTPVPNAEVTFHWTRKGHPGKNESGKADELGRLEFKVPVFDEGSVLSRVKYFRGQTTAEVGAYPKEHGSELETSKRLVYDGSDSYEVVLRVPPRPVYEGVVLDPDGNPVPGATVYKGYCIAHRIELAFKEDGSLYGGSPHQCDENGHFRFMDRRNSARGLVFIAYHEKLGLSDGYRARLKPGHHTFEPLVLELPQSAYMRFEVVDHKGKPIADLPLRLKETEGSLQKRGLSSMKESVPLCFKCRTNTQGRGKLFMPAGREYRLLDGEDYPYRVVEIDGKPLNLPDELARSVHCPITLPEGESINVKVTLPRQPLRGRVIDSWGLPIKDVLVYQQEKTVGCTDREGRIRTLTSETAKKTNEQPPKVMPDLPIRFEKERYRTRQMAVPRMEELAAEEFTVVLESGKNVPLVLKTDPPAEEAYLIDRNARGMSTFGDPYQTDFYGMLKYGIKRSSNITGIRFHFDDVKPKRHDLVIVTLSPIEKHKGAWVIEDYLPTGDDLHVTIPDGLFTASLEGTILFSEDRKSFHQLRITLLPKYIFGLHGSNPKRVDYLKIEHRFPKFEKSFLVPELQPGVYHIWIAAMESLTDGYNPFPLVHSQTNVVLKEGLNHIEFGPLEFSNKKERGFVEVTATLPDGRPAENFEIVFYKGGSASGESDGTLKTDLTAGHHDYCIMNQSLDGKAMHHGECVIHPDQTTHLNVQLDWVE